MPLDDGGQQSASGGRVKLDHVGIAVRDPAAAARLYEALLGVQPYKRETVEVEGVRTHFIDGGAARLELLEALSPKSPVAKYLEKRGEGLHHVAFEVEDVHAEMARLRGLGFTPLSAEPRSGADGKLIFFLHPRDTHGVLVEFCQAVPVSLTPVRVPFRDGHLAAYEAGHPSRPTILLLHGAAGANVLETLPLLRILEPHYRVIALDFTGHGGSDDLPDEPLSMALFAENARAVLDHFDAGQAHVFGYSMGGYAALMLAQRYPRRVNRLAVHATNIFWDGGLVKNMLARIDLGRLEARYPEMVRTLRDTHGAQRWPALHARLTALMNGLPNGELSEKDLGQIAHSTLVSTGDRDELFGLDHSVRLHRALPDSSLAVLPGMRHALQRPHTEALAGLLRNYFG